MNRRMAAPVTDEGYLGVAQIYHLRLVYVANTNDICGIYVW